MVAAQRAVEHLGPVQVVHSKNSAPLVFIRDERKASGFPILLVPGEVAVDDLPKLRHHHDDIALGEAVIQPAYENISTPAVLLMPRRRTWDILLELQLIDLLDLAYNIHGSIKPAHRQTEERRRGTARGTGQLFSTAWQAQRIFFHTRLLVGIYFNGPFGVEAMLSRLAWCCVVRVHIVSYCFWLVAASVVSQNAATRAVVDRPAKRQPSFAAKYKCCSRGYGWSW